MIIGFAGFAQSPNIQWTAHSSTSSVATVSVKVNTNLYRTGSVLTWQQSNAQSSSQEEFTITSIQGHWDAQNMIGAITYKIHAEEDLGEFRIIGDGQNITMNLEIGPQGEQTTTFVFYIDSFNLN